LSREAEMRRRGAEKPTSRFWSKTTTHTGASYFYLPEATC